MKNPLAQIWNAVVEACSATLDEKTPTSRPEPPVNLELSGEAFATLPKLLEIRPSLNREQLLTFVVIWLTYWLANAFWKHRSYSEATLDSLVLASVTAISGFFSQRAFGYLALTPSHLVGPRKWNGGRLAVPLAGLSLEPLEEARRGGPVTLRHSSGAHLQLTPSRYRATEFRAFLTALRSATRAAA